jgi:hypothetical protein
VVASAVTAAQSIYWLATFRALLTPDHTWKHWTGCYNNTCKTHKADKEGQCQPQPRSHLRKPQWATEWKMLTATKIGKHLKLYAQVNTKEVFIMIDSGVTGNFISPGCMRKLGLTG